MHEATGYEHRTPITEFDVFTMESLEPTTKSFMPPYKQGFFQIALLNDAGDGSIDLNTKQSHLGGLPLWFVVPGQVYSWVRDPNTKGYHVAFKKGFLANTFTDFYEEFPFLKLSENYVFRTNPEEHASIASDMERILQLFNETHPYQVKRLSGVLSALLYNCKAVYERYSFEAHHLPSGLLLTQRFQQLVDKLYLESKNVNAYADHLHVTPNHLTAVVKEQIGKTAKDVIQERVFLESKNLLKYTEMDISRVAYTLNFSEPTHFTRFFKKYAGQTPLQFRMT